MSKLFNTLLNFIYITGFISVLTFTIITYINIIELKNKKSILNLLNSSKLNKYSLN